MENLFTHQLTIKYTIINISRKDQENGQIINTDVLIQMQGAEESN